MRYENNPFSRSEFRYEPDKRDHHPFCMSIPKEDRFVPRIERESGLALILNRPKFEDPLLKKFKER